MSELGREINSRSFDSSIIIKLNEDGSICKANYAKKVKLINNKLEFENDKI